MLSVLISAAKQVLPRQLVRAFRRIRLRHRPDEVFMVASLCDKLPPGVMVDVGAHFGGSTHEFLSLGWKVVAYEPDPKNRHQFEANVGMHPKVQLSACAVSNQEQRGLQLFSSDVSTGISGLSAFHSSHRPSAKVDVVRLDKDLPRRGIDHVDFLKIDVEGFDFFVLQGFDWAKPPRFVLYEFENKKTVPLGYDLTTSSGFMTNLGYHVLYSVWDPITEYGANHTWRGLFKEPPKDANQSWGNVLCFREGSDRDALIRAFGS